MEKKKRVYKHRPYQAVANLSKVTEEQKSKVKELYLQGSSQSNIEKTLQMTRKTIRTILKVEGIDRDKSSQWRLRYKSSLKENVFDDLNPESLYWIGFLYADGHVRKSKEFSIELGIHSDDIDHMKKYKQFLGCNKDLKFPKNKNICKLKIHSKVMHSRLKDLGFSHTKSLIAKPHILLKNSRDFWRGCIDGDGGVYDYEYHQVFLCGTLETIFDFIIFCGENTGVKDKYPSQCIGKNLYQVHYYGKDAIKILDVLYKDSVVSLDRKYKSYLEITKEELVNLEITS